MRGGALALLLALPAAAGAAQPAALEALQEYLEFATYSDGAISPGQLASVDAAAVHFVDTRNAAQYAAGHIPGAVNIDWREILTRRDEIPAGRPVVLYCDTGLLSSRALMALRVAGRDDVKVLLGGYAAWLEHRDGAR
ncbi:MAG TPA: rhodanese-like domain-containing protein [Gammaproteobacteria bacterium]